MDLTLIDFVSLPNDPIWGSGPLLVVRPIKNPEKNPEDNPFFFDTPDRETLVSSDRTSSGPASDYLLPGALVLPVSKAGKNPFPFVSVGRAGNNDVCLTDRSVSKVHAYFIQPDATVSSWRVRDAGSLNGSVLLLGSGPQHIGAASVAVSHGTEIKFGVVRCLFTDRETLLAAAQWAARTWKKPTDRSQP